MPASIDQQLLAIYREHQAGQWQKAEKGYRQLLDAVPEHAAAWCFLGMVLADQSRSEEAEAAYRKSLAIDPKLPESWNNLGNVLRMLGRHEESESAFHQAIGCRPQYVTAAKNRGTARHWRGNIDSAIESFREAIAWKPDDAESHRNLGVMLLLKEEYEEGWIEYRHRWNMPTFQRPSLPQPVWDGGPVEGKRIYLYAEQGLGDTIQFIRTAAALRGRGASVIASCPASLIGLLQSYRSLDGLVIEGSPIPAIDAHCSMIDAADRLQWSTHSLPPQPPYLHPQTNLVHYWERWLSERTTKGRLRIGIAWQGNPQHEADRYRSFPLATLEPLLQLDGIDWICMQQGHGVDQWKGSRFATGHLQLPDTTDRSSGPFLDSAAILQHVDLLITSDSAIAHLAGAVGANVFVLLAAVPDWRWGLRGQRTPWYPTMRLFRQQTLGDWTCVIEELLQAIAAWPPPLHRERGQR
jgi:tetratricopeptide (TPR) repeat protein